jgi:hypothetical protein
VAGAVASIVARTTLYIPKPPSRTGTARLAGKAGGYGKNADLRESGNFSLDHKKRPPPSSKRIWEISARYEIWGRYNWTATNEAESHFEPFCYLSDR